MTWLRVPPTLRYYTLERAILERTSEFLRRRGEEGLEATVAWLGRVVDETHAKIIETYAPEQIGYASEEGVAVEVTQRGLAEMISSLPEGMFVVARVHSHPSGAYHSSLDDENMLISHEGAISIVVPHFACTGMELATCSINELRHGQGWRELAPDEVAERFTVT
jgi:proteasome lid subunit RPN8/RPN11